MDADREVFLRQLEDAGVAFDATASDNLGRFARAVLEWNDRLNLVSRRDAANVFRKHIAASAGVLTVAEPMIGERWVDVGTGAGFPGMVIKILRPHLAITLVESSHKRCVFLEAVVRELGLTSVDVRAMRAETLLARDGAEHNFDLLTSRAVSSVEESVREFAGLLRPGGRFLTFKGPSWEAELSAAHTALTTAGLSFVETREIPWVTGRIVVLEKQPTAA